MPHGLPTVGTIAHVGTGKTTMIGAIMTALRLQEARGHVPHTCAGFLAYHRSLHGVDATAQDVWNAAIRSFKDLSRTTASPMGAQASQDGSELTGEYQWTEEKSKSSSTYWQKFLDGRNVMNMVMIESKGLQKGMRLALYASGKLVPGEVVDFDTDSVDTLAEVKQTIEGFRTGAIEIEEDDAHPTPGPECA